MPVTKKISPLTRINGFWNVEITVDGGRIVDAKSSGIYFRGFEKILIGRDPRDAVYLTQRICGICSTAHAMAASFAIEDGLKLEVPRNAILMRNLTFGADLLQNHIRHFYLMGILDYVKGPDKPPFIPRYEGDYRFSKKENDKIFDNYRMHFEYARKCHELVTLFGGKIPHQHAILPGAHTVKPTMDKVYKFMAVVDEVFQFIDKRMLPDMEAIADKYSDYYNLGVGVKRLMSFGNFAIAETDKRAWEIPFGIVRQGQIEKVDTAKILEHIKYAWFKDGEPLTPDKGETEAEPEKETGYSWSKAPRYDGEPVEVGPLAHMWVKGDYQKGVSTMDRLMARVLEAKMVAILMKQWLKEVHPDMPTYQPYSMPGGEFTGVGLLGAMRGALGHWIKVRNKRIVHYQVVTPSAWNCSPMDDQGVRGPIEQALIGTPIVDINEPIEVGRIARSFDPCLSCAVHLITPTGEMKEFVI